MTRKPIFFLKSALSITICLLLSCCATESPKNSDASPNTLSSESSVASSEIVSVEETEKSTGIEIIKTYETDVLPDNNNFSKETFTDTSGLRVPYRLHLPENRQNGKKYPVILFLHGAGETGRDNEAQLPNFIQCFNVASDILKDVIIICPQTPSGWSIDGYLGASKRLTDSIISKYGGDPDRVYLTGLSLGSFATWDLLDAYPNFFAAAVPVCGGGGSYAGNSLINTSIWIYHGTSDTTVSFSSSQYTYNAIKNAGGKLVKFTVLEGVGHNAWDFAYKDREMFCWLLEQKLNTHKSMDFKYINVFEIVSPSGKTLVTEDNVTYTNHKTTKTDDYITIKLNVEDFKKFTDEYNKNKDGAFSIKIAGKKVYDFKFTSEPTDRTIRIESTMDKEEFNRCFRLLRNVAVNKQ